jgi:hypothetical protein
MRAAIERSFAANKGAVITSLIDNIERMKNLFLMARQTGDPPRVKKLDKWLATFQKEIEALLKEGGEIITPPRAPLKPDAEIARSLAVAIEGLAKGTGAGLWQIDTLHSQVALHAAEVDRVYWQGVAKERVSGMLRTGAGRSGDIFGLLESRGILTWFDWRDQRHRIVDTNWLTAHADIRAFVTSDALRGKRCRFCRISETPSYAGLISVDPEKRNPLVSVNDVVQVQKGTVNTHQECLPYWNKWVAIASQYATPQAAEEADQAAGRAPRAMPAVPAYEPDQQPEVPEDGTRHYCSEEQGYGGTVPEAPKPYRTRPDGKVTASELAYRSRKARGKL